MSSPVWNKGLGTDSAAIAINNGQNGEFPTLKLTHEYKDGDQFKPSTSFTIDEALSDFEDRLTDTAVDRAGDVLGVSRLPCRNRLFQPGEHARGRMSVATCRRPCYYNNISESTRNMLRQRIADGLASGAMREDTIDGLGDFFDEDRATLIADTEVSLATGQGALAGYKEAQKAGLKLKKV
jgi:hypothetical protein